MDFGTEAIQQIERLTRTAQGASGKVVTIDLPKEPDDVYGIVHADGKYERVRALANPRRDELCSIDQIEWINKNWPAERYVFWIGFRLSNGAEIDARIMRLNVRLK